MPTKACHHSVLYSRSAIAAGNKQKKGYIKKEEWTNGKISLTPHLHLCYGDLLNTYSDVGNIVPLQYYAKRRWMPILMSKSLKYRQQL